MLQDFKRKDDNLDKAGRKAEIVRLRDMLVNSQQKIREAKLPVIVLLEGWDSAGKGYLINELISEMDPRFFNVATFEHTCENDERYPFLKKFFDVLPENGKYKVEIIDIWEMTRKLAVQNVHGQIRIGLPGKEGIALLITRLEGDPLN